MSAPGKLAILGEHAIIFGRHCIVTAMNQRISTTVGNSDRDLLFAPEMHMEGISLETDSVPKGASFVHAGLKTYRERFGACGPVRIDTRGFSSSYGLGSSSAVTVCVIYALARLNGVGISKMELFRAAYDAVIGVQGIDSFSGRPLGSGYDIAAAIWGGTLDFAGGGTYVKPIRVSRLPLVVAYTGIKAETVPLVRNVASLHKSYLGVIEDIFNASDGLVALGVKAIQEKRWNVLGELMNINHGLLVSLGVSTPRLDSLVSAARDAGAYGAKLSGAGGGDCMIALVPDGKTRQVVGALTLAGGQVLDIRSNARGVRAQNGRML